MEKMALLRLLCVLGVISLSLSEDTDGSVKGRGFGDGYQWRSFKHGIKEAEASGKPSMVVIHKSWCGACKALGPEVAGSKEIADLAAKFVMINVSDDEENTTEEGFRPDGGYIPRIIFYDGLHGEVLNDYYNKGGNAKYKYYHTNPQSIAKSMKEVLDLFETDGFKPPPAKEL